MTELLTPTDRALPAPGPTTKDAAATALVLGFAGAAWGGWAHDGSPASWSLPLTIGSLLGLLLAVAAGIRTFRCHTGESAMGEAGGRRVYHRAVAAEVVLIVLGVAGLDLAGRQEYLAAWVLFVVGVHFVPLGRLFRVHGLTVAGVLLPVVAAAAAVLGVTGHAAPAAVAGTGGLVLMLVVGALALYQSMRRTG